MQLSPCVSSVKKLLLRGDFLLARHCLALAFARARIGPGALTAHRQSATMPQTAITADVHQPLDVLLHLAPRRAFHLEIIGDDRPDACDFLIVPFADAFIGSDPGFLQNRRGGCRSDP